MTVNIKITLEQVEYSALGRMAINELRAIPEEARFIIRKELERRGLLENQTDLNIVVTHKEDK